MSQILGGAWSVFNAVTILSFILIVLTAIITVIFAFVPSVKNKTVTMHTWGLIVMIGSLLATPLLITGIYFRDAIKNTNHPHLNYKAAKDRLSNLNPFGRRRVNNDLDLELNADSATSM